MNLRHATYWLIYEWGTGRRVRPELERLLREQYLPPDELESLQTARLRALLEHAGRHVPYYRELFRKEGFSPGDVRSPRDLAALPPLERATVRDHPEMLLADTADRRTLFTTRTSGSTGMPVAVQHDRQATSVGTARYWRAYLAWGHQPGDRIVRLLRPPEEWNWKTAVRDRLIMRLTNDFRWYVETETVKHLESLVRLLQNWQPSTFRGYLEKLTLVANYLEHTGRRLRIPRIVSGASPLTDEDRTRFRNLLGDEVFDYYSSEETLGMAFECPAHEGLHLANESFVIEPMAGDRLARPGELGEVFVTALTNYAMPLIRYRLGDTLTPLDRLCSCGRTLPLVRMTHGRILDILSTPDGRLVSPSAIIRTIRALEPPAVAQLQVIQETLHRLRIRIVKKPAYTEETEARLDTAIRELMGREVAVEFDYPESIEVNPRTKTRVIESKVPIRFDRPTVQEQP
ncbi:MAG: hypothetical protein N3D11_04680 [Candidatus Sumerlaeia bacterium]|nr:hypothetical protein [Candidatus Sumerlaeia bacterium]